MGYCPFLGLYRDREFSVAIENAGPMLRLWSLVMTRSSGQELDPAWTRTMGVSTWPRCVRDSGRDARVTVTRQCARDRDFGLCVATESFVSQHGSQANRAVWVTTEAFSIATDFLALCHDKNSVSRQGLGMGQAWVVKRVSLCRERVFPRLGHSCRDRVSKGGVATGCFFVATHRPCLRARQSAGRAHDRPRHALEYAHQRR